MIKLSIIIVNYNTYNLTKQTIDSILDKEYSFSYEIILIDNASIDGSIEMLEQDLKVFEDKVHILINSTNLGFAKANNQGIRAAKGEYILLLNSDTFILEGCLQEALSKVTSDRQIGALGGKVMLPDGSLDHACKRGFPTPKAALYYFLKLDRKAPLKYGQYDALHLGEDESGEVDVLMGAFMLMPKKVLHEVGLLDEAFFMYGEDIDLCYRIKGAGYKVFYYPQAKLIHYKGGSSKKKRHKVIYDFHEAMWLFYKKHYFRKYSFLITALAYSGIWLKCGLALVSNLFKKSTDWNETSING